MNTIYYPEMNEAKPIAEIEVSMMYGTRKRRLVTALELPAMRGLTKERTYRAEDLTPYAQDKVGFHVYIATEKAYKTIEKDFALSQSALLD